MSPIPDDGGDLERMSRRRMEATAKGSQAFLRRLNRAETVDSGQDFPYDLCELRLVDIAIGDDTLACLDALRWAQADLHTLVPDGAAVACRHRPLEPKVAGRRLMSQPSAHRAAGARAPCPTLARPAP